MGYQEFPKLSSQMLLQKQSESLGEKASHCFIYLNHIMLWVTLLYGCMDEQSHAMRHDLPSDSKSLQSTQNGSNQVNHNRFREDGKFLHLELASGDHSITSFFFLVVVMVVVLLVLLFLLSYFG